jgi:hypothetical protein
MDKKVSRDVIGALMATTNRKAALEKLGFTREQTKNGDSLFESLPEIPSSGANTEVLELLSGIRLQLEEGNKIERERLSRSDRLETGNGLEVPLKTSFCILSNVSPQGLQKEIQKLLDEGWGVDGDIGVISDQKGGVNTLFVGMVKYG